MDRRPAYAIALVLTAGLALAGCGGSHPKPRATSAQSHASAAAKPKVSAAAACSGFDHWYLRYQKNLGSAGSFATLTLAVAKAPSGQLYKDMSTLQSDVLTLMKQSPGTLRQAEQGMTVEAAYAVEQDCQSVNPGS